MKLRSIASAAALVCVAAPSFALTPADIDGSTVQLWINGATAPTAAVYGAIAKLCNDNGTSDLHVYLEKSPAAADQLPGKSAAGKFAAYACTMGPNAGALAGLKTVVYHTFDVGSFEAYTPHLVQAGEPATTLINQTVKRLNDITAAGSTCTTTGAIANTYIGCGSAGVLTTPNGSSAPFALPTMPVGGISDTEYTLNQLNLGVSKSLSDIGSEVSTNVAQGFGVAMSYPLYIAMQAAQGLQAGGACPAAVGVPDLSVACQPNITRMQYASLVSSGVAGASAASVLGVPAAPLTVQRRVGTSGTQSASNAFFLNKPCATGLPGGELSLAGLNTAGAQTFGTVTINSNSGSGDVKSAITAASTAGTYALGVLSLENSPSSSEKFAFAKVNGVSPTTDAKQRQTAINGAYEFWYEMVAFTANSASAEGADLMNSLTNALGDPTITDLKGLFVTPLNVGGFTNATNPTQVSKGFKAGNACSPIVQ